MSNKNLKKNLYVIHRKETYYTEEYEFSTKSNIKMTELLQKTHGETIILYNLYKYNTEYTSHKHAGNAFNLFEKKK